MKLSDRICDYILDLLKKQNGTAQIKRNELAIKFACVPSQINYVISSRFKVEQGYIVESQRGGGGFIKVTRSFSDKSTLIMHIINSIGESLDVSSTRAMLHNMYYNQLITKNEVLILQNAVSEQSLTQAPKEIRDLIRASIFKNILLAMKS